MDTDTETKPEFVCEDESCSATADTLPAAVAHLEATGHALTASVQDGGVNTIRVSFDDSTDDEDDYDEEDDLWA